MTTGCWSSISGEAMASEYTLVLDSLKVLKADELDYKDCYYKGKVQYCTHICQSEIRIKISQGNKEFKHYLNCEDGYYNLPVTFSIKRKISLPTDFDVFVDIEEDDDCCDDSLDCLVYNKNGTFNPYKNCRISLDKNGKEYVLTFFGNGDSDNEIKVKLTLHVKPVKPKGLKLDEAFIGQIDRYIPQDEQKQFIKDYVRPHTDVNIIFDNQKIKGKGKEPFFNKRDNKKIVPPYLKWNREEHRAYIRFVNGEPIENLQGTEGIAIPILQWLTAKKNKGVLVFSKEGEVNELFRLATLNEKRKDDYWLQQVESSPVVHLKLADEIGNLRTLKLLIRRGNSLTVRYYVDGMPFSKTLKPSDITDGINNEVTASLPSGDYEPEYVAIEGEGIFSLFSFEKREGLSFDAQLNRIKTNIEYPSYYHVNDKKNCNPLKNISTSNLVRSIINKPDTDAGNCLAKGKSTVKTKNCPFLTVETVYPCIANGEIVLDLAKVAPLQVQFTLGSKNTSAANWWIVKGKKVKAELPETGQIELFRLPRNDFTLEPPAHLITRASKQVGRDNLIKQGKNWMKREGISTSGVNTIPKLRWHSYSNPLVIDLGKSEDDRVAESHLPSDSLWSKIRFSIKKKGEKPFRNCFINKTNITCPNAKSLKLNDLVGTTIEPIGLGTRSITSPIKDDQLIDILCGRWEQIFPKSPGVDIYVPNATYSSTKNVNFNIGFYKGITFEIPQSHQVPQFWGLCYSDVKQRQSRKTVFAGRKRVAFSEESAIFEWTGSRLVRATVVGDSTWLHCQAKKPDSSVSDVSDSSYPLEPTETTNTENTIFIDLVLVAAQGYNHSRRGWTTFFAQQKGEIAKKISRASTQCEKSLSLSIYALYLNKETEKPELKKLITVSSSDLSNRENFFNELDETLNSASKLSTLPRRIKNQVPLTIRKLLPRWGFSEEHRVGILLHGDKMEDDAGLNIGQIEPDLQDRQRLGGKHRVILLSKRQPKENRVSINGKYTMTVNGEWVNDFFSDLLGDQKCE
jgi:hypothetical protein